jgi:hypothetical protein
MVKLIGRKRALVLFTVLALDAALAAAWLLVTLPAREQAELDLQAANGQVAKLSMDIQNVKKELADFPANHARYDALEKGGFLSSQDRFEAGRALDGMREKSGLLGYTYRIDALRAMADDAATAEGLDLVASRLTVEGLSSVLDTGVFSFLRMLPQSFPQHLRLERFEINRSRDVSEGVLKSLAVKPEPLVSGSATFDWLAVVPHEAAPNTGDAGFRGR